MSKSDNPKKLFEETAEPEKTGSLEGGIYPPATGSSSTPSGPSEFSIEEAPPAYSTVVGGVHQIPKPPVLVPPPTPPKKIKCGGWKAYLYNLFFFDFAFALFCLIWTWTLLPLALGLCIIPLVNIALLFFTGYTFRALALTELVILDNLCEDGDPPAGYQRPKVFTRSEFESGMCGLVLGVLKHKTLYTTPIYFLIKIVVSITLWVGVLLMTLFAAPFFCFFPTVFELTRKGMEVQRGLAYQLLGRKGSMRGESLTVVA